jgi:asparagine synthetase B (glutamine-hydrolysing)
VVFQLNQLRKHKPAQWVSQQFQFMLEVWSRFHPSFTAQEFAYRVYQTLRYGRQPPMVLRQDAERIARQRQSEKQSIVLPGADALNDYLYRAVMLDSIPTLLHYEDRNSMAYGIEARVPFLDHRLVEFALGVPAELKVHGPETKLFVRRALKGVLPAEVVNRKDKLGYPTPFANWLRGPLRKEAESYLFDKVLKREWYDAERVKQIWRQHNSGARNYNSLIYQMITAEQWYEQFSAPV